MSTEELNHRNWHEPGTYEVWYLTWNDPRTDEGYWLRYLSEAPVTGPARGELWFARFDPRNAARTFGFHKHFGPPDDREHPFALTIGGAQLGHDHAIGELAGGGHRVHWELRWEPANREIRQLPELTYTKYGNLGVTSFLSPSPRVPLSGSLVVDGETINFDRVVAGQTHVWGKRHATSWAWGRCGEFAGAPGAVLELVGARQHRGVQLPTMLFLSLDLDGERHRMNQFRHQFRNRASWGGTRFEFAAWSPTVRIEGEMTCTPDQMVLAPYLDPDGTEVFCANTEIGDALVRVYRRSGLAWREQRVLVGTRRAHFEIGGRTRDPAVTREHLLVE
jgi:hypothetical protein